MRKSISSFAMASLELEHAIGFTGAIPSSLFAHPSGQCYVSVAGGCVVIGDLSHVAAAPASQQRSAAPPQPQPGSSQVFLRGHDDDVSCLALSRSGKFLASGQVGENADVVVWDFDARKVIYRLQEHDHGIKGLAFSPDERLLFTVGTVPDFGLMAWDMSTGAIVSSMTLAGNMQVIAIAAGGFERDIKRRPTHRYLFAVSIQGTLLLWTLDPFTGEFVHEKVSMGHVQRNYTCLVFSSDCEYLYAGSSTGDFATVHVRNRVANTFTNVCGGGVHSIALCGPDRVVCGGGDGSVVTFRSSGGGGPGNDAIRWTSERKFALPTNGGAVTNLSVFSNNDRIVAGTATGDVFLLRLDAPSSSPMGATTVVARNPPSMSSAAAFLLSENHCGPISDISFPHGVSDRVVSCSPAATEAAPIRLWDLNSYASPIHGAPVRSTTPSCVTVLGELVLSGWSDRRIRAMDLLDGSLLWTVDNAHRDVVSAVLGSNNMRYFISGGNDGEVRVWELKSREMFVNLKEHTNRVTALAVFADDAHVISASRDKCFLVWDLRRERRVASYAQKMGGINDVCLANDQVTVLTVGSERKITYWDLRAADPVRVIDYGHDAESCSVALSHSNKFFVTAGSDQAVRLWDFSTGRCIAEGLGHSKTVSKARFSPDDRQVVSVGADGCMLVWNVWES